MSNNVLYQVLMLSERDRGGLTWLYLGTVCVFVVHISSQHNADGKYLVDSNLPQTEGTEESRAEERNAKKRRQMSKDVQIL